MGFLPPCVSTSRAFLQAPLRIATLGVDRCNTARELLGRNSIKWVIGGHSLGGVAACKYVASFMSSSSSASPSASENPLSEPCGLLLWAAYPSDTSIDLSPNKTLPVLTIQATCDKVLSRDRFEESKNRYERFLHFLDEGSARGLGI